MVIVMPADGTVHSLVWTYATRYPERWSAIAPSAAPLDDAAFPYEAARGQRPAHRRVGAAADHHADLRLLRRTPAEATGGGEEKAERAECSPFSALSAFSAF